MRKKIFMAFTAVVVGIASLMVFGARVNKPRQPHSADAQQQPLNVPPLISATRDSGVYIESATPNDKDEVLFVTVRNDTDKEVDTFVVKGGDEMQSSNGHTLPGQGPAIAAHSTARITFSLRNASLMRQPIVLKSVIFADGTEAGSKEDRDAAHRERQKVIDVHARDVVTEATKGGEQQQ